MFKLSIFEEKVWKQFCERLITKQSFIYEYLTIKELYQHIHKYIWNNTASMMYG